MDDLRQMTKAPVELFGMFIAEACSILTEETLTPSAAMEKFQHAQESLGQVTEQLLKTFRQKVIEKEEALQGILHPVRQDLPAQARDAIKKLSQIVRRFSLRHKLTQGQSSADLLTEYQEALYKGDLEKIEVFEAEAERFLADKKDDLAEQALKALQDLARVIARFSLKEKLTRAWEEQSAAEFLGEYEEALAAADTDTIEVFEAEAERLLARKGDPQAEARFVALKSQPRESRLTPAQREAKAALQELSRIKEEAALAMCVLASMSRFHAGLVPLCTQWRLEVRHPVDEPAQQRISASIRTDAEPSLPVSVLDWSKSGLRVECPEMFPPGTTVGLSLQFPGVKDQAMLFKAEVRWFHEEPNQPGLYVLGLRIVRAAQIPWWELLPKLVARATEIAA
jgi:hypothetical protein